MDTKILEIRNIMGLGGDKIIFPEMIKDEAVINSIINIVSGGIDPQLSSSNGQIKLFELDSNRDNKDIKSIFDRYVKLYGSVENLTDIFEIENKEKYEHLRHWSGDPVDATYRLLKLREQGVEKCLESPADAEDKAFYEKMKKIEIYPENPSDVPKSCHSLRYGEQHYDEQKHVCTASFDPDELLPLTISKDGIDMQKQLPYNERQYVFGIFLNLEKYEKCRSIFIARKIKNSGARTSCHSLVEWTHVLNTLYTLCSKYTGARFIRFVLDAGSVAPAWKFSGIGDPAGFNTIADELETGSLKLVGIITMNFKDDRPYRQHPTRILYLFLFESTAPVSDKLHSYHTRIKITDIFGLQTYIGTLFGANSVTYTEFNQLLCYLELPVYRGIVNKFILFLDPKNKDYRDEELAHIGIERIKYICVKIFTGYDFQTIEGVEINNYEIAKNQELYRNRYKIYHYSKNGYVFAPNDKVPDRLFYGDRIVRPKWENFNPDLFRKKKYIILIDDIKNTNLYTNAFVYLKGKNQIYISSEIIHCDALKALGLSEIDREGTINVRFKRKSCGN